MVIVYNIYESSAKKNSPLDWRRDKGATSYLAREGKGPVEKLKVIPPISF